MAPPIRQIHITTRAPPCTSLQARPDVSSTRTILHVQSLAGHHGRQDGLAGPHQPPAQHADKQLPQPARDALTQPETLGWGSGHAAGLTVIATGAADGLGRRQIIRDAAAEPAAHPFTFFAAAEAQRRGMHCGFDMWTRGPPKSERLKNKTRVVMTSSSRNT